VNSFGQSDIDREALNQELGLPPGIVLAPIWRRVLAQAIDQLVILVPVALIAIIAVGVHTPDDLKVHAFGVNVAVLATAFFYDFGMIALWGRTVGKIALGTQVVRVDSGGAVLPSSAAIRSLVPLAAGVAPGIGYALSIVVYARMIFDKRRQGWHDKGAGTIVVIRRSE
jgi:hypothetical protein